MENIEYKKEEFARKEILFLVFQSSLNRGYPVYDSNANEEKRIKLKLYLADKLEKFSKECQKRDYKDYIEVLNDFQKEINNSEYKNVLKDGNITFGRVQKLLNLYLKYQWVFSCDKNKKPPPHCPIDSIILKEIKWDGPSWTTPKFTEKEYKKVISEFKEKTKNMNIAEWELLTFRNRSDLAIEKL